MPRGEQLPEAKALNPDHCFVAALGLSGEQDSREKEMEENMEEVLKMITRPNYLPIKSRLQNKKFK